MSNPSFSVEIFPPKDEAGEERMWLATAQFQEVKPDFISVTYGAGGSTRDRTVRIASELTARTGIPTIAHLTCVGSTRRELEEILDQYQEAGIQTILALRGDPVGGPSSPWVSTAGGFDHADQLVELAMKRGDFKVGVAAFPDGHPASHGDLEKDIDVLLKKESFGASFATTQFFFEAQAWISLVDSLKKKNSKLDVFAGILPVTSMKQLTRIAQLGGAAIPKHIEKAFAEVADNETAVRELGIEIATSLCRELITAGVPGLHFYSMNSAQATLEIIKDVGLR